MQSLNENPAITLRDMARALQPSGMLKWDTSGDALLLSDAPRRDAAALQRLLRAEGLHAWVSGDLLRIDLLEAKYATLLDSRFLMPGPWHDRWCPLQSLLSTILTRRSPATRTPPSKTLLRKAMLASAQGIPAMEQFLPILREADTLALRTGNTAAMPAAASLCAHWLWTREGIGLPMSVRIDEKNAIDSHDNA